MTLVVVQPEHGSAWTKEFSERLVSGMFGGLLPVVVLVSCSGGIISGGLGRERVKRRINREGGAGHMQERVM